MTCPRCTLRPDQTCSNADCPRRGQEALDHQHRGAVGDDPTTWPQEFRPVTMPAAQLDALAAEPYTLCSECEKPLGGPCGNPEGYCPHRAKASPLCDSVFADMHEQLAWNDMREALFDGRHLILQLDPDKDWSKHPEIARWHGGVVGHWCSDEDTWIVSHDPTELENGSNTFFDSRWFTGWKHLPTVTFEGDAPKNKVQPPKPDSATLPAKEA